MITPPRATRASKPSALSSSLLLPLAACLFPLATSAQLTLISGSQTARVSIVQLDPSSVASWSNAPILGATGQVTRADGRLILTLAGIGGASGLSTNEVNGLIAAGTALNATNWLGWSSASNGLHNLFYPIASNPSGYLTAPATNSLATRAYVDSATNAQWTALLAQGYVTGSITNGLVSTITGGGTWTLANGAYTFTPTGITAAVQSALDGKVTTNAALDRLGVNDGSGLTHIPLTGLQVVPLTNNHASAVTLGGNVTLNGTANLAPNQTAASGSSLMTRDLGDARYLRTAVDEFGYDLRSYRPWIPPGASVVTATANGGFSGNGGTITTGSGYVALRSPNAAQTNSYAGFGGVLHETTGGGTVNFGLPWLATVRCDVQTLNTSTFGFYSGSFDHGTGRLTNNGIQAVFETNNTMTIGYWSTSFIGTNVPMPVVMTNENKKAWITLISSTTTTSRTVSVWAKVGNYSTAFPSTNTLLGTFTGPAPSWTSTGDKYLRFFHRMSTTNNLGYSMGLNVYDAKFAE
jgi:hypothetical protein